MTTLTIYTLNVIIEKIQMDIAKLENTINFMVANPEIKETQDYLPEALNELYKGNELIKFYVNLRDNSLHTK